MTPPTSDATPSRWTKSRPPTVNDLKSKRCWICLGESDAPELAEGEVPRFTRDRWVHACKCSLVSHESCLLTWIESSEDNVSTATRSPQCPQCATRYTLKTHKSHVLRLLNRGYGSVTTIYTIAGVGRTNPICSSVLAGNCIVGMATYGGVVLRLMLGEENFYLFYGDSVKAWSHHILTFSLVPLSLVLGETRLFTLLMPLSLPFMVIPSSAVGLGLDTHIEPQHFKFPPSLPGTLFFWTLARPIYEIIFSRICKRLTGKSDVNGTFASLRRDLEILRMQRDDLVEQQAEEEERVGNAAEVAAPAEGGAIPPNHANDDAAVLQAAAPGAEAAPPNPPANANLNRNANANPNNQLANPRRVLTMTFGIVASNLLSSLLTPFAGVLVGNTLHRWALSDAVGSGVMRQVLGVSSPGRFGFGSIPRYAYGYGGGKGALMPLGLRFGEELDPVWWRTSVGVAVYRVCSDGIALLHLWLATRERKRRSIMDRSFAGIDPASLDLKD
ncbi:hypothetical protein DL93DRAFT_2100712 [Clavulina sp. PMI_390]|nr:hypothetical protein DL93DRAFT_2100712 [Clavulina sp. PMI_390]